MTCDVFFAYFGVIKDSSGSPVYAYTSEEADDFYTGLVAYFDEKEPDLADSLDGLEEFLQSFEEGCSSSLQKRIFDVGDYTVVVYAVRFPYLDLF